MTATALPALVRRTTVFVLVPGLASGRTDLFLPGANTNDPDNAFAQVVWEDCRERGEVFADVAVVSQAKSRLFGAVSLAEVLLLAFEWVEQEAGR